MTTPSPTAALPAEAPVAGGFLGAADRLGARLCRDAIWAGERCNWVGAAMEFDGGSWVVAQRAGGPDLYGGTSGIALFLARLAHLTGERVYRLVARGAIRQALSRLDAFPPSARLALYAGAGGVAYVLVQVAELLADTTLGAEAEALVAELARADAAQAGLDVTSGAAGAIPLLLGLRRRWPDLGLLELAVRLGDHLLAAAHRGDAGWSWDTIGTPGQRDLTGFSHGTAGIGWALLELDRVVALGRFRRAAEQAFRYERHWYNAEQENWPDFRGVPAAPGDAGRAAVCALAWCHGAPGIGLSRLRAYQLLGDDACRAEAEAALRTTARMLERALAGGQDGFSLCHGLAGNAELLLCAAAILADGRQRDLAERLGRYGIQRYLEPHQPWPCGVLGGGETPGLLLGLAGIGHFYLRLAVPATPSVLLITPED